MTREQKETRPRATDLGLAIGLLPHGEYNTITDVTGVQVGHATIITGEGQLRPGEGPIRTGITMVLPHSSNLYRQKVPAAAHALIGF